MIDTSNKNAKIVPVLDGTLERRLIGLAGMAWAATVLEKTGLTASKANQIFSYHLPQSKAPKTLFHQYLRGERAPMQGIRGQYSYDMVAEVEKYIGSAEATQWLNHPLWEVFSPKLKSERLRSLCTIDENNPPKFSPANLMQDSPENIGDIEGTADEPTIGSFGDYVYQCALFRLTILDGYWVGYWQIHYLADKAAVLEPTFAFVKTPFLKMVADFYGKPDWKRTLELAEGG